MMPFFFSLLEIFCLLSRGKDKVSISRKEDGQLCYQLYTETESHNLKDPLLFYTSLVAQLAKNPPVMQKTCVWSLSWADTLEKGNTYSSILALRSSGMDSPWDPKESDTTEWLSLSLLLCNTAIHVEGQESLVYCSPQIHKELDTT